MYVKLKRLNEDSNLADILHLMSLKSLNSENGDIVGASLMSGRQVLASEKELASHLAYSG